MLNGVFQRHAQIVIVIGWAVAVGYHIVRSVMKKTGTEDGLEVLDGDETLERAILRSRGSADESFAVHSDGVRVGTLKMTRRSEGACTLLDRKFAVCVCEPSPLHSQWLKRMAKRRHLITGRIPPFHR